MKKEVVLAITIGLVLGLIITFGVYQTKTRIAQPPTTTTLETIATQSAQESEIEATGLSILNPKDQIVQVEPQTVVRGTTFPNSHIVVLVNDADYVSTADELGDFSVTVELASGANILVITALNPEGAEYSTTRTVVVTTELEVSTLEKASESAQTNEES